ncbi:hypothetical protein LguiA_017799 [Lonicera macranthoides]
MSGSTSAVTVALAGEGFWGPSLTAVQWQELEHQALIYKYLVAGIPVPADLVIPIRMSLEALSASFFHNPSTLGYCSYYGKKFDPEPGRCRRTDGKKWRCSKDAYMDSKYCERHMHRGRNRSRKPVESQPTSQSLSIAAATGRSSSGGGGGTYQSSGNGSFQNLPLYSAIKSDNLSFGSNVPKLNVEPVSYGTNNKEYRYIHGGLTHEVDEQNFSSEASRIARGLGMDSATADSTWRLMPPQVHSASSFFKSRNEPNVQGNSSELHMPQTFEPTMVDAAVSKQQQQHCFFRSEIEIGSSPGTAKQEEPNSMCPFFDNWPTKARESWSDLDEGRRSNKNTFSTTQLSISTPVAPSDFSTRSACSPDGAADA